MALCDAMAEEPRVAVMGEDIGAPDGSFKATRGLLDDFGPRRVIDTLDLEASIACTAVGAALSGPGGLGAKRGWCASLPCPRK